LQNHLLKSLSIRNNAERDPIPYEKCRAKNPQIIFLTLVFVSFKPIDIRIIITEYANNESKEREIKYLLMTRLKTNGTISDNIKINGIKCLTLNDRKRLVIYKVMIFQNPLLKLFFARLR